MGGQAGRQAGRRSECGMSAAAFYAKLYKGIQRNTHTQTHACTCSPGKCLLSLSSLQSSGNSLLGTRTVCIMMHCSAWRPARPILPSCPAASPACFLWSSPLSSCLPACSPAPACRAATVNTANEQNGICLACHRHRVTCSNLLHAAVTATPLSDNSFK